MQLANRLFIENIRTYGRQYEMRLAAVFNVKSGQFLKDLMLGPKLLTKGKLKMFHQKNKNLRDRKDLHPHRRDAQKRGSTVTARMNYEG